MLHVDLLITIAIISTALAGFASVVMVTALDASELPPVLRLRLANLLILCLLNTLFALLPPLLTAIGTMDDGAFRISQLLFAVALSGVFATRFAPSLRLAGTGSDMGIFVGMSTIFFIAILFQIISAAGASFLSVNGSYIAGLTCVLMVSGISFLRLVLAPRVDTTDVADQAIHADTTQD